MTNQILERNQNALGAGGFSYIERTKWSDLSTDMWTIPMYELGVQSITRGLLVSTVGITASVLSVALLPGAFWISAFVSVSAGVITALTDFQKRLPKLAREYRNHRTSLEICEKEQAAQASQSEERITVELRDTNNGYARVVNAQLNTSIEKLRQLSTLDALSVRSMQDVGLTQNESTRLLTELITRGLLVRKASNKPAQWTNAGIAMRDRVLSTPTD